MAREEIAKARSALETHKRELGAVRVAELFRDDPQRFARFHVALDDLIFDFSKHRLTERTFELLLDLARSAKVEARRAAMFAGEAVNTTEHRPALHMALRNLSGGPMFAEGVDVMPEVLAERRKMEAFAESVRNGRIRATNGERFTDIVNFGIGGSDLGPKMAAQALAPFVSDHLTLHFVANVDGADISDTLKRVPLSTTLFIICSKTFTTLETMTNARTARECVARELGEKAVADHFCAVSTHLDKIAAFGVRSDRVFGFWDWVGGRYSIWSSIGLSLAIGIGAEQFEAFLRGGEDIDTHFVNAPLERNIPVLMALLGVWYRDFWGFSTLAVIPYDERLGRFPAYIQQLDMESNGKSVDLSGAPVAMATAPIIFGEPGTNCQHAFFQLFHQGQTIVPVDFLVAAEPVCADLRHHHLLLANCFAQSQALMLGRSIDEVVRGLEVAGVERSAIAELAPHKVFDGDRPSSTFLYKQLTPRALGRLIALYEHKIFVQGVIWNINSFDQWGVELGKELAIDLAPIIENAAASTQGLDASTAGLIEASRRLAEN